MGMKKYTIKYLGRSRLEYLETEEGCLLNLNTLILRPNFNKQHISRIMDEVASIENKLNLYGFASLCYRLGIDYNSDKSLELAIRIKDFFRKYYPFVYFCQNQIMFDGETDMQPLESLYSVDDDNSIVYCHKMLVDKLELVGFSVMQIPELLAHNGTDLVGLLPYDVLEALPIVSDKNLAQYHRLCEVFEC